MRAAFIKLHISIFLAGFTGILGKLILLPEGPLVWHRMAMTSILFLGYLFIQKKVPQVTFPNLCKIFGIGALVALHWIFFYGSVKYANVSIAVVCFAATGFFTAIFEPIFYKKKPSLREVFFSLIVIAGIALIFHFDSRYRIGIILGILCAVFAALFTIGTKEVVKENDSGAVLLYEMIGGTLFLSLLAPGYYHFFPETPFLPSVADFFYLLVLASICTIGMFLLEIQALEKISAFTASLSFNLEPVYSIVLAMLFLGEASEVDGSFFSWAWTHYAFCRVADFLCVSAAWRSIIF